MTHGPAILSLATAVPPHVFMQTDVAMAARRVFAEQFGDFDKVANVFATAGVVQRHGVRPFEWYLEPQGWPERTGRISTVRDRPFRGGCLEGSPCGGSYRRATSISSSRASSTGIATPEPGRAAPRTARFPDGHRAGPGLRPRLRRRRLRTCLAARLAEAARREHRALRDGRAVAPLRCGLDKLTAANVVATALFAEAPRLRSCGRSARPRQHRRRRQAHLARHPRHHGLGCRPAGFRRHPRAGQSALCGGASRGGARRHARRAGISPSSIGRYRLPSRRAEDHHRSRTGARASPQGTLDHEREMCCATAATCPRRRCSSSSSGCSGRVCPTLPLLRRWGPASRQPALPWNVERERRPRRSLPSSRCSGLAELGLARRNTRRLLAARGAVEVAPGHYPADRARCMPPGLPVCGPRRGPAPGSLAGPGFYLALQVLRVWVSGNARRALDDADHRAAWGSAGAQRPLSGISTIRTNRSSSAEIAVLPLAFGLLGYAIVFSVVNAAVLRIRIRAENRALAGATADAQ